MRKKMTLTRQLVVWFVTFGTIPALVVMYLSVRAIQGQTLVAASRFQEAAESIADKIDRNLFERYGDVQAFGYNAVIENRNGWYDPSEATNPIVTVMNRYVDAYDIYYLSILVDLDGRVTGPRFVDQVKC